MITYTEAKALVNELRPQYDRRHWQAKKLRDYWHGRYWDTVDSQTHGIASLFRDITSVKSDIGPDIKLVRNLAFDVCVKFQTFLSTTPMIRTFVDRPDSRSARARADLKQRVLYGTWSQVNMNRQLNEVGWHTPLMGDCFLGIWPDFERSTVQAIVRSVEHAYPIQNYDGTKLDALVFCWKTTTAKAKRAFPNWNGEGGDDQNKTVEILEYSDTQQFSRWVGEQETNSVEHNLNFNLFDQVPFIQVPGEPFNHGAVEQSINMIEAGNALWSLEMQAAIDNVFPKMIIEDPMKFPEVLDFGPGSVNAVNPGGKAYYLPTPGMGAGAAMLQAYEQAIKQDTSMPDASFGQIDASIITGKAISQLQGAGTGSLVEMVQGNGIGPALESWNEKALTIYQRMWADDQIYLEGIQPTSMFDLNPKQFSISFKGSQIVGSPKNDVVFSPYMDQHDKLIMALQSQGAGLTSKKYGRDQIGVTDSDQMQEEIVGEVLEEAVIGALVQALQADPSAQNADKTEAQVVGYIDNTGVVRAPPPRGPLAPPGAPSAPGGQPQAGAPATLPGGGQVVSPPLPLPQGSGPPQAGAPPSQAAPQTPPAPAQAGGATSTPSTLPTVTRALQSVQGITGRVWLVGQILTGQTTGPIDVSVTNPADRQTISGALSQYQFVFHVVKGVPPEKNVEVTPQAQAAA